MTHFAVRAGRAPSTARGAALAGRGPGNPHFRAVCWWNGSGRSRAARCSAYGGLRNWRRL